MANSVDPDLNAPIGAVCSGSTLFASILNSPVMLDNYLQYEGWSKITEPYLITFESSKMDI